MLENIKIVLYAVGQSIIATRQYDCNLATTHRKFSEKRPIKSENQYTKKKLKKGGMQIEIAKIPGF